MPANPNYLPMFEGESAGKLTQLTNGTPGTLAAPVACWTANANDAQHINRITVSSNDTGPQTVTFVLTDGTLIHPLCAVNIPLGAGTVVGAPAVDILANMTGPLLTDAAGNKFLEIPKNWYIAAFAGAVTAAKFLYITVTGRTLGVPA